MPRTSGSRSESTAAAFSFALSAKCAETRSDSVAVEDMRGILLDVNLEAQPPGRVRMLGERADPRPQRRAAVEAPRQRGVLAPRHVAELVAAPPHGDGV